MELYEEFFKIAQGLNAAGVSYAVVGGVAYAFHVQPRFTKDIDFLVEPSDLKKASDVLSSLGYFESAAPWTFKNTGLTLHRFMKTEGELFMMIDVMAGEGEPYDRILASTIDLESQVGTIRLASKEDLIWMKSLRNSDQDQVDIKGLRNEKN